MKHFFILTLCTIILFSSVSCIGVQEGDLPVASSSVVEIAPSISAAPVSIATASPIPPSTTAAVAETEWELPSLPVISEDPMAICNLFPDPNFALWVAQTFDREMQDPITLEELSAYTGELDLGIGEYTYDENHPYPFQDLTGIGYFTNITYLGFCKNDITELPAEIGNCVELREIDCLKAYSLTTIPPEIGKLTNLETFRASLTPIEHIPEEMCTLPNLKALYLGASDLQALPDHIGNLQSLEILDVSSTQIDRLPDSICALTQLQSLDIGHNPNIKALPENFGNLLNLTSLDMFGCDILHLPKSMKNMENLQHLNVYDNYRLSEEYKEWFDEAVYD